MKTNSTRLKDALFDELEARLGKSETNLKQLERETHISSNTLNRLFKNETTPYYPTRRRLKKFLGIDDEELNLLIGVHTEPDPPEQQPDVETASEISLSSKVAKEDVTTETDVANTRVIPPHVVAGQSLKNKKYVSVGLIGSLALMIVGFAVVTIANSTPEPCLIDFRLALDDSQTCKGIGEFSISGPYKEAWSGRVTAIDVPEGWAVHAKYENWLAPKYEEIDQNGNGYVRMKAGHNTFTEMEKYPLFRDFEQKDFVKITKPKEMNDRIQYIVISEATDGVLKVHAHKDPENEEILFVESTK